MPASYVKKGDTFNYLTLTGEFIKKSNVKYYECICVCGNKVNLLLSALTSGNTKSCGCKRKQLISISGTKHGYSSVSSKKYNKLYSVWIGVKNRCYNKNHEHYSDYGGRGIVMCKEWEDDFVNFYNWAIENGYKEGLTLERNNNDGIYEPNNCRWATRKEQARNKRNTVFITAFGEIKSIGDWVDDSRCVVSRHILYHRFKDESNIDWTNEKIITTPLLRIRVKKDKCA